MINRNSYYDGKQRYEIRRADTKEIVESGFTSQKAVEERLKQIKKDLPHLKFMIWVYKDSER